MSSVVIRNETAAGTKTVETVTQKMLADYLRAKEKLTSLSTMILNSLKLRAKVEGGEHTAYIESGAEKRPNWRAALLENCGADVVAKVRDATEPSPFERLRVE
jgi:hypothetical protein